MVSTLSRILIVDDSSAMRKLIQSDLQSLGYHYVGLAADGQEALDLLYKAHSDGLPFDLILCDWKMPKMDGMKLLSTIRNFSEFPHIPIVMVTSEGDRKSVLQAAQAGISDYLVKPFDKSVLQRLLQNIEALPQKSKPQPA